MDALYRGFPLESCGFWFFTASSCCPVLTVGILEMNVITLIDQGKEIKVEEIKADNFLGEIFRDRKMPQFFSLVGGQPHNILNALREELLREVASYDFSSASLLISLAKFAFACACLQLGCWGERGPTLRYRNFKEVLVEAFDILKHSKDFSGVVLTIMEVKGMPEHSKSVLTSYLSDCFRECQSPDELASRTDCLIMIFWAVLIAKHARCNSKVMMGRAKLFRRVVLVEELDE